MSANSKMKELSQQLLTEKTKLSTLEKCYQEKVAQQAREIEALHARMQQSHDQHQREIKSLQTTIRQYEQSNDRGLVQKLQEVKHETKFMNHLVILLTTADISFPASRKLTRKIN